MTRRVLAGVLLIAFAACASAKSPDPVRVHLNGVDLTYIEEGAGEPVLLLHGGLGDYTSWQPQMEPFAKHYRVISYSRRYSYPNRNPAPPADYSVTTDVADLAALIGSLHLRNVRLVGQSYGGSIALVFATRYPTAVHSMVLSEPPAHELVRSVAGGEAAYQAFIGTVWIPAGDSFRKGDTQQAMRTFMNGLAGGDRFDGLPTEVRDAALRNAPSMRALALSADPFGGVAQQQLQQLRVPTLIVTGENTIQIHKMVNAQLVRLLAGAEAVTISKAGHGSPRDNPADYNEAALRFFRMASINSSP